MSKYKEAIRSRGIQREVLEDCPVLGRVGVREIQASEFIALTDKQAGKDFVEQMQLAAVVCLEDPDTHEPILDDDDAPHLTNWGMLRAVNDACNRCCGIKVDAEGTRKN